MTPNRRTPAVACVPLLAALLALACGAPGEAPIEPAPDPLLVYSGRNEALIGPLLDRFPGVPVEVRYGDTAEMAATLMEEGENTPADLFISQDAAALGALAGEGLLVPVPERVLVGVADAFRPADGAWVGLSGRARTVVYNTGRITPEELPQSLEEVTDPRYRGRFGVAPTNGSFQAHMAAYRSVAGPEALEELLAGMVANEPKRYPKNSSIVDAVLAGEVDFGLVNHYYLLRALDESPGAPGANHFQPEGRASSFVNLSGAGLLSERPEAAELVAFLLSEDAQIYFARETFEYPVHPAVSTARELVPLDEVRVPEVDFTVVAEHLEPTLEAIAASGLIE